MQCSCGKLPTFVQDEFFPGLSRVYLICLDYVKHKSEQYKKSSSVCVHEYSNPFSVKVYVIFFL